MSPTHGHYTHSSTCSRQNCSTHSHRYTQMSYFFRSLIITVTILYRGMNLINCIALLLIYLQNSMTFCITQWILFLWLHSMIPSMLHLFTPSHYSNVMKSNYIMTKDIVQKCSRKQTNSKKVADVSIMTPAHLSYCISVCQVHAVLSSPGKLMFCCKFSESSLSAQAEGG